jgi:hypothetical protein
LTIAKIYVQEELHRFHDFLPLLDQPFRQQDVAAANVPRSAFLQTSRYSRKRREKVEKLGGQNETCKQAVTKDVITDL